jgi:hypothetical protein
MSTMRQDFATSEERARLAAADLQIAAKNVIALHSLRLEDVHDDVDAAVLSRRFTSLAASRELDDAREDLDFAKSALTEIGNISVSARAVYGDLDPLATEGALIGRLAALAAACERRAVALRT